MAGIHSLMENNRDRDNYEDLGMFYEQCVHKLLYSISREYIPGLCLAARNYFAYDGNTIAREMIRAYFMLKNGSTIT